MIFINIIYKYYNLSSRYFLSSAHYRGDHTLKIHYYYYYNYYYHSVLFLSRKAFHHCQWMIHRKSLQSSWSRWHQWIRWRDFHKSNNRNTSIYRHHKWRHQARKHWNRLLSMNWFNFVTARISWGSVSDTHCSWKEELRDKLHKNKFHLSIHFLRYSRFQSISQNLPFRMHNPKSSLPSLKRTLLKNVQLTKQL